LDINALIPLGSGGAPKIPRIRDPGVRDGIPKGSGGAWMMHRIVDPVERDVIPKGSGGKSGIGPGSRILGKGIN
jgi:hypothetical protein